MTRAQSNASREARKGNTATGGPLQGFRSIRGQFFLSVCLTAKLDAEPDFRQSSVVLTSSAFGYNSGYQAS